MDGGSARRAGPPLTMTTATTTMVMAPTNFGNESLRRRDRFCQKIVEIGAILRILRPFEDLQGLKGRLEKMEMPIWRSYELFSVTSRFVSKN